MPKPEVYISGCHSDPDPSPGLGIARSLREAFPDIRLIGVDYSVRSSGLHSATFDRAWVQPVWGELDLDTYARQIHELLSAERTCWLSGLDVEIDWLAGALVNEPRLLIPSAEAQVAVRKPRPAVAGQLGMRVPPTLPADAAPVELHQLGRRAGWHVWAKGTYHEAYLAFSFQDLGVQLNRLQRHWPLEQIFVQGHVNGLERAYTFAAFQGRLLGIVQVEKRSVTGQGKTWAASITEPETSVRARIESFVTDVGWTGGGEVEFIRSAEGTDWLLDFNPRFPAYIHGVTLCGINLPAMLVAAALGLGCPEPARRAKQFIRVIHEIPVLDDLPLPPLNLVARVDTPSGKHPSFQPELVRRLTRKPAHPAPACASDVRPPPSEPDGFLGRQIHLGRERDWSKAEAIFDLVAEAIGRLDGRPKFVPALSIKTDPEPELASRAVGRGWWAEVISGEELEWALRCGFPASRVVFNGPLSAQLLDPRPEPLAAVFADSLEALARLAKSKVAHVVGFRLRLPSVASRFGINVAEYADFVEAMRILSSDRSALPYGIHFHVASDTLGPTRWNELVEEALSWAVVIADALNRSPIVFDLGGGWHPDDFRELFLPSLGQLQAKVRTLLPEVERVIFEPGKAVAAPTGALPATILEVRERAEPPGSVDVLVDVSIADLPMAALYAPRMELVREGHSLGSLRGGTGRVLGSICMENDILAQGISFPVRPRPGDVLLIHDAGGYNSSMAWPFAKGVSRDG